ncbi:MAG: DUF4198 domain-containing protein [Actinomycetota bacterium]
MGAALALLAQTAIAHEYWIAPESFRVEPGERIQARLLVGQMMEGTELPWLSHQIRSFEISTPQGAVEVQGLEGDLPALSYVPEVPGLHVIAHETFPLELTFDTLEEFEEYLDYEGLGAIIEAHLRRSLPKTDITEAYARSAKALVQVGPVRPDDADRPLGLAFELVALANPYAGGETLPVRLLWQGQPEAGTQISIFRKNADVDRSLVLTDADGRAEIPLAGGGEFLLNAVHIEPVEGEEHVWASTWASLSFGIGKRD